MKFKWRFKKGTNRERIIREISLRYYVEIERIIWIFFSREKSNTELFKCGVIWTDKYDFTLWALSLFVRRSHKLHVSENSSARRYDRSTSGRRGLNLRVSRTNERGPRHLLRPGDDGSPLFGASGRNGRRGGSFGAVFRITRALNGGAHLETSDLDPVGERAERRRSTATWAEKTPREPNSGVDLIARLGEATITGLPSPVISAGDGRRGRNYGLSSTRWSEDRRERGTGRGIMAMHRARSSVLEAPNDARES